MGTWNFGIKSDDFVLDVMDTFKDYLKQNRSIAEATNLVSKEYASSINDVDDGPLFWIALGELQWTYGELDKKILEKIKDDYANERGLERWAEQSQDDLQKRKKVIEKFIHKLETKNSKPNKIPKIINRPPIYEPGDCLSILLKNNQYGAALVLTANHEIPELGTNIIGTLNYLSNNKPTLNVFKKREWLKLTHHKWNGQLDINILSNAHWRKEKNRFEVIGNIPILNSDPKVGEFFITYTSLGYQIQLQKDWEKTI
jgi:hypothetical protein